MAVPQSINQGHQLVVQGADAGGEGAARGVRLYRMSSSLFPMLDLAGDDTGQSDNCQDGDESGDQPVAHPVARRPRRLGGSFTHVQNLPLQPIGRNSWSPVAYRSLCVTHFSSPGSLRGATSFTSRSRMRFTVGEPIRCPRT